MSTNFRCSQDTEMRSKSGQRSCRELILHVHVAIACGV